MKKKPFRQKLPIMFTGRALMYPFLIIAALIFAQALKMPISNMIFIFVLLLPLGTAFQLVMAAAFIRTSARADSDTAEKRSPIGFSTVISNGCLIPFPFIEAELAVPDERGAKCVGELTGLALSPFSGCEIRREAEFAFRGIFEVGLSRIYVYDSFRTVRLRLERRNYADIFVLPRRYELPPRFNTSESDQSAQNTVRMRGLDNTELSDIRGYIKGDSLKSIHWKLSSKSPDLIVKDYSRNNGNSVYIVCDLEAHYAVSAAAHPNGSEAPELPQPVPEYADIIDNLLSDLVVEHCLAAALRELRAQNMVTLLWLERRSDFNSGGVTGIVPNSCVLSNLTDFDTVFRRFAAAPILPVKKQAELLIGASALEDGASVVFVTSCLDSESTSSYMAIASSLTVSRGAKSAELLYCTDDRLFVQDSALASGLADRKAALSALMEVREDA